MASRFIKTLALLGVPVVALGVTYLLIKSIGFKFNQIDPTLAAAMVMLFLVVIAGMTVLAIRGRPARKISAPPKSVQSLSAEERLILQELVRNTRSSGAGVAVDRFESNLRRLGLGKAQAPMLIASLQSRDLISLEPEVGWDHINNRTITNPVYKVTEAGCAACSG